MTQEGLAAKLGISRSALSHYEKNRREPDYATLSMLADLFNVSTDYLLGRTDEPEGETDSDDNHDDTSEPGDHALLLDLAERSHDALPSRYDAGSAAGKTMSDE